MLALVPNLPKVFGLWALLPPSCSLVASREVMLVWALAWEQSHVPLLLLSCLENSWCVGFGALSRPLLFELIPSLVSISTPKLLLFVKQGC